MIHIKLRGRRRGRCRGIQDASEPDRDRAIIYLPPTLNLSGDGPGEEDYAQQSPALKLLK